MFLLKLTSGTPSKTTCYQEIIRNLKDPKYFKKPQAKPYDLSIRIQTLKRPDFL